MGREASTSRRQSIPRRPMPRSRAREPRGGRFSPPSSSLTVRSRGLVPPASAPDATWGPPPRILVRSVPRTAHFASLPSSVLEGYGTRPSGGPVRGRRCRFIGKCGGVLDLDLETLRGLAQLLTENDITEFEHEAEGVRLKLVRGPRGTTTYVTQGPSPAPVGAPALTPSGAPGRSFCVRGASRRRRRHHEPVRRHVLPGPQPRRPVVRRDRARSSARDRRSASSRR